MASVHDIVSGLQLLASYLPAGNAEHIVGADEHTLCGLHVPPKVIAVDDLAKLEKWLWHYDTHLGCWCRYCN